ncbi:hypothetical protein [Burkholderia contaminans]|uniref:hypothetical protein n=1 Tax=Burkholderia contaminans TaxID=488447 RepID=UPI00158B10FD|nr:hypothetical protein [Burkholderia contaminans]
MKNNNESFLTVEVGSKGIWGVGELHSDIEEYLKSEVAQTFHKMVVDDGLSLRYEFKSGYDKVHKRIFILDGDKRVDEVHGFNEFITDLMPEVFGKIGKYRLHKKLTEGNPVNMVSGMRPGI